VTKKRTNGDRGGRGRGRQSALASWCLNRAGSGKEKGVARELPSRGKEGRNIVKGNCQPTRSFGNLKRCRLKKVYGYAASPNGKICDPVEGMRRKEGRSNGRGNSVNLFSKQNENRRGPVALKRPGRAADATMRMNVSERKKHNR